MNREDVETLADIERAAYAFPWSAGHFRDCLDSGYACWVAEHEGQVVGYWLMMMVLDEGHILNCCIARPWQRRGWGRRLMAHLFVQAQAYGIHELFLEVRASNLSAQRLYESVGFAEIARRRAYYPADSGREDALIMRQQREQQMGQKP